jgi:hypothetical protein
VRRRWKIFWIGAGVLALPLAFTGWRTYEHIEHDPEFCTSCHLMHDPFDRWQKSAHSKIECHACHESDTAQSLRQLWLQLTKRPSRIEKHAEVDHEVCGKCHLSNDARWKQVASTAGHDVHFTRAKIECVTCHAPSIHVFRPAEETCVRCHQGIAVKPDKMHELHCHNCHEFLAKRDELVPGATQCMRCHREGGGATSKEHGGFGAVLPPAPETPPVGTHAKLDCAACHKPHGLVVGVGRVERASIAQRLVLDCRDCHAVVPPTAARAPENGWAGSIVAAIGHTMECGGCHQPHGTGEEAVAACRSCHEMDARHAGKHEQCTDCHAPHDWRLDATRCARCHAAESGTEPTAPVIGGHGRCESCHEPGASPAARCGGCHGEIARAVAAGPAAHEACSQCHDAHAPRASAAARCASCHAERAALAAGRTDPHRDCGGCHAPHAPAATATSACERCHGEQAHATEGSHASVHGRCSACHDPHRPGVLPAAAQASGATACGACHEAQARAAKAVPADRSHARCQSCHAGHGAPRTSEAQCRSCHAAESRLTTGAHARCASCHPTHGPPGLEAGACAHCHASQATSPGTLGATHARCGSCHRPHAATEPAGCASCHAKPRDLGGLHALAGHARCADCHATHAVRAGGRDGCLGCHAQQRDHEPQAARCQTCHPFR